MLNCFGRSRSVYGFYSRLRTRTLRRISVREVQFSVRSKLSDVGTTIFTVMTKMAHESQAFNLSQGFPDFDCPEILKQRVIHYLNNGRNQYAPMAGVPELREQIAIKLQTLYDCQMDMDTEITITS